ncbi:DUF763 domain-containing protein [Spirochaetia bacterium 38H-sp]|uniref:DUF763 domain-containing protein n=1 Tax=Rarispira pelagica TaxID=3141764 RepID=A0ABU9UDU1_9SPIR
MNKKGSYDLPLHYGKVPHWLALRMEKLAGTIAEEIVSSFGTDGFLSRISNPDWFQAFSCLLGMDWHSSGSTTTLLFALQKALQKRQLGIVICGGRGRFSKDTPRQLMDVSYRFGADGDELVKTSRLVAKIDNNCIQDGFSLYLHTFILADNGKWCVVQQGMNDEKRMARRYHWLSDSVGDFFSDPHTAIIGENEGEIINLSDSRASASRDSMLDFLIQPPVSQYNELRRIVMPTRHNILPRDINLKRLGAILAAAYDKELKNFADLVLMKNVGPRTMQSLALVAELVYGNPVRFSDPARFSFAHGGKDGHPFPVMTCIYDNVIAEMDDIVHKIKLPLELRRPVLKNLHNFIISIERQKKNIVDFYKVIDYNKKQSMIWGGKTASETLSSTYNKSKKIKSYNDDSQLMLFE